MRRLLIPAVASLALAGCASTSSSIQPMSVSSFQYDGLQCQQIAIEAQRISANVQQLAGKQDEKFTRDAVITTVGLVVFWPALLAMPFVSGNDQQTAALAQARGEMIALEQASMRKRCGIVFHSAAPVAVPESAPYSRERLGN